MWSLRARLNAGLIATLIIFFVLQWGVVSYAINHVAGEFLYNRLRHDAEALLVALDSDEKGVFQLNTVRISDAYHQPFSGHYYRLDIGDQTFRSRSLWDEALNKMEVATGEIVIDHMIGPQEKILVLYGRGYKKNGRHVVIVMAHDVTDMKEDIVELQFTYAFISVIALMVLIVLQRTIIMRGLRPVLKARAQIQALERGESSHIDEGVPAEILPLVQEINRLILLLQERLQRSRNALGNLAHTLKTPLTLLAQQANRPEIKANPELQKLILEQTDVMRRFTERELKRARLASQISSVNRFDLHEDVASLVETLKSVYANKNIEFFVQYPVTRSCPFDREDVLELLGNLLENACKWTEAIVSLNVIYNDRCLCFTVEDDGPGVGDEKLKILSQRGTRIDESTAGYGLGLAIVHDIVKHYDGTLIFSQSKKYSGLLVDVCLMSR